MRDIERGPAYAGRGRVMCAKMDLSSSVHPGHVKRCPPSICPTGQGVSGISKAEHTHRAGTRRRSVSREGLVTPFS